MPLVVIDAHYRLKSQKETSFISEFHQKKPQQAARLNFYRLTDEKR